MPENVLVACVGLSAWAVTLWAIVGGRMELPMKLVGTVLGRMTGAL